MDSETKIFHKFFNIGKLISITIAGFIGYWAGSYVLESNYSPFWKVISFLFVIWFIGHRIHFVLNVTMKQAARIMQARKEIAGDRDLDDTQDLDIH
jgi:hypothetical protein